MTNRPRGGNQGDRIGELYDRFAVGLYHYALMILADPAAAGDAVQQVFVALLRLERSIDSDERYLRRAVHNECYSALRRRRRDPAATGGPLLDAIAATDDRPDERIAIEQALRALPAEQREVLHLKVFEGMTFREIADLCGESMNTVASRYRYGIEKLRAQLGAERK
jgi:RNA polymerase sigma-70 factor (ECF subfamily)